jgi:hypothetical protein
LFKNFPQIQGLDLPVNKKCVRIFSSCEFKELPKLAAKVLSTPISNAYMEEFFPVMENVWSFRRNRMIVELVKAEICVKENFCMIYQECYQFIRKPEEASLLTSSLSNKNYTWMYNF